MINLFEKVKNLLSWKNVKSTRFLYLFLIFMLISVTFFPIRYIIIIFIIWKFNRGWQFWDRVWWNNWEIALIELKNFFNKQGIWNTDFYSEHWPKIKDLDKKIVAHFQQSDLYIPDNWLKSTPTPDDLINAISLIWSWLQLKHTEENHDHLVARPGKPRNPNLYFRTKNIIELLLSYIMNNVTSDFYLQKYPKEDYLKLTQG